MVGSVVRAAVAATLAAGVVGLVRQTAEVRAARRGERIRPTAATTTVAPPSAGRLARTVGDWTPQRPRTAAGQVLATVWAAPLTTVGLVVGFVSRGTPEWNDELGCLIFRGCRGPAGLLHRVGASANAIGQVVIATADAPSEVLLVHEAAHVRQAERLGPLLAVIYLWWGARYGYRDNPLERAARAAARNWVRAARAGR